MIFPFQSQKPVYRAVILFAILLTYQLGSSSEVPKAFGSTNEVTVKEERVYYGNPKNYTSPAQLELVKVLDATKEYQRIKKEKIKSENPLYWILLQRTNEKVQAAIKKVAENKKYDLVGELGYITGNPDPIPDITQQVIGALDQK
ncbi:MAG: OmpH family outer membrane protein [bacterium]|nr:OmpH family outer membrane protein [bacterium]